MILGRLYVALAFVATAFAREGYTEHLELRPLPDNALLTSFRFDSHSVERPRDEFFNQDIPPNYEEYALFPRSLGQIIDQSKTRELHLRFSQGWWDSGVWGVQPDNGAHAGGIGVELWAKVQGDDVDDAMANWKRLVNILSGFFCASLNFIDSANTVFPARSFGPVDEEAGVYLMHGALPSEPVCTENLTPFVKLLPCKGKAGISSLLDGHKLFDAQWQSMSIDVSPDCVSTSTGDQKCSWKMTQKIDAVVDIHRALGRKNSPVPTPVPDDQLRCDTSKPYYNPLQCFPLKESAQVSWNISDIFGKTIKGACPLATNQDHVSVLASDGWSCNLFTPLPEGEVAFTHTGNEYTLIDKIESDISMATDNSADILSPQTPPVYVERSFTGHGDKGGLRTVFTNPSPSEPVSFVYLETLPWFMRVYLHTIAVTTPEGEPQGDVIQDIFYSSAKDRERPAQLELVMTVPQNSSIVLSYDFEKTLLYLSEYPPDANHGFSIAPGILTTLDSNQPYTFRTTSLLLSLPTPDFSMPYNVIILSCTVLALGFGTFFNLLTKKIVPEEYAEKVAQERPLGRIIAAVRAKVQLVKQKLEPRKRGPFPYVPDEAKKNTTESATE